ncbi:MAG: porin [Burkholderiales bacterium]
MRKTPFAMAAASLLCAAAAHAQSSVTVFGTLDLGAGHVKNGAGSMYLLKDNGASTSKIAFKGTEDLGDGLSAIFWLEGQTDPDVGTNGGSNGTATAFWNRRSTVGMAGKFGEFRLGRDYVPAFGIMADFDPANTNGSGNALNLWTYLGSGAVTEVRANNAVSYFLPGNLGGFSGQVMVAPGEGLAGQKYVGARFGYATGALKLSAAFGQTDTANADTPKFKTASVGGSYNFGFATLQGFANHNTYDVKKATTILIGAVIPVPIGAGEIRTSYQKLNASGGGTDANDASQVYLGYWYYLSKRTSVYANVARLSNKGAGNYVISGGPAIGSLTGFSNTGYEFGLRHFF